LIAINPEAALRTPGQSIFAARIERSRFELLVSRYSSARATSNRP
jgi:hypothetical protein